MPHGPPPPCRGQGGRPERLSGHPRVITAYRQGRARSSRRGTSNTPTQTLRGKPRPPRFRSRGHDRRLARADSFATDHQRQHDRCAGSGGSNEALPLTAGEHGARHGLLGHMSHAVPPESFAIEPFETTIVSPFDDTEIELRFDERLLALGPRGRGGVRAGRRRRRGRITAPLVAVDDRGAGQRPRGAPHVQRARG